MNPQDQDQDQESRRPRVPHLIRRLALADPAVLDRTGGHHEHRGAQLEEVGKTHNVALNSPDAPSLKAIKRNRFRHSTSSTPTARPWSFWKAISRSARTPTSSTTEVIRKLQADKKHVEHVQDFWGDTLTAAGSQSSDGKAAYVQVFLAGNQGSAVANEAVGSIRDIVDHTKPPPGVKAYVTGAAPSSRSVRRRVQGDREGHPRSPSRPSR